MLLKYVYNNSELTKTYQGINIAPYEYYLIPEIKNSNFANDSQLIIDISNNVIIISSLNSSSGHISDINEAINFLKNLNPIDANIISQVDPPPFAEPTFRTKINATSSIITIPYNESTIIDFQLTEERYVSGGCIIVENAQVGDYVVAEVYDKDSIIPEAYRTALCENWPCVSKYIEKQWLKVCGLPNCIHEIDTKPLNAKISAGLYLRVIYYPNSEGDSRRAGINYYLTKKL